MSQVYRGVRSLLYATLWFIHIYVCSVHIRYHYDTNNQYRHSVDWYFGLANWSIYMHFTAVRNKSLHVYLLLLFLLLLIHEWCVNITEWLLSTFVSIFEFIHEARIKTCRRVFLEFWIEIIFQHSAGTLASAIYSNLPVVGLGYL